MKRSIPALLLIAAMGGCATSKPVPPAPRPVVVAPPPTKADAWRRIASAGDADRLARIDAAWTAGLADARAHHFGEELRKEGLLLKPAGAQQRPAPSPGSYSCRMVRIGTVGRKAAFERFKPFFCYVEAEGELLTIVKQTGSRRPAGRLWEDDVATRLVYLGSLALGNEEAPLAYGEDPRRDMAGVMERVAPFVWRLVIPWPQGAGKLDVYELTPVAEQPK